MRGQGSGKGMRNFGAALRRKDHTCEVCGAQWTNESPKQTPEVCGLRCWMLAKRTK